MGAFHETNPQYMGEWVSAVSDQGVLIDTPGRTMLKGGRVGGDGEVKVYGGRG